jgi:hypothetical protein
VPRGLRARPEGRGTTQSLIASQHNVQSKRETLDPERVDILALGVDGGDAPLYDGEAAASTHAEDGGNDSEEEMLACDGDGFEESLDPASVDRYILVVERRYPYAPRHLYSRFEESLDPSCPGAFDAAEFDDEDGTDMRCARPRPRLLASPRAAATPPSLLRAITTR